MTIRVATLGPTGTFSEGAVIQHWEKDIKNVEIIYTKDFSEIFDLVEQGKADYGVFPLEDSVVGDARARADPLELLRRHDLYLVGEEYINVVHCLLGKKEIENIKVVATHPQVLLHCQRFLRIHLPGVEQKPVGSTAEGARIASVDSTYGAIGSERLEKIYDLNVLRREVHDSGINDTRIGIVKSSPIQSSDPAKTSIIVYPKVDRPGVLSSILEKLARAHINLTRIASRPLGRDVGEYIFFIDFEGNLTDPKVRETLEQIKKLRITETIRELGSYPKSRRKAHTIGSHKGLESTFDFWDNEEDRKYDSLQ